MQWSCSGHSECSGCIVHSDLLCELTLELIEEIYSVNLLSELTEEIYSLCPVHPLHTVNLVPVSHCVYCVHCTHCIQ